MTKYDRPLPIITSTDKGFWEGAKRHELMVYHCSNCGAYYNPPTHCVACDNPKMGWVKASGKGKVFTYVIYHVPYHPAWKNYIPYNVAWVELEEGLLLMTNIVGCKNEEIFIDMPVEVVFEDITEEITLPKFKPDLPPTVIPLLKSQSE
jgi:uncharacterized OB-fold protein